MTSNQNILNQSFSQVAHGPLPSELYRGFYKRGCRCLDCRKANSLMIKRSMKRRLEKEPEYYRNRWKTYHQRPEAKAARANRERERSKTTAEKRRCIKKSTAKTLERRELFSQIKLNSGCVDCGYNKHSAALDFDHVSGEKFMGVSKMGTFSMKRILEEISKCVVRCMRCHRIQTKKRSKNGECDWFPKRTSKRPNQIRCQTVRDRNRQYLADLKLSRGCVDCGYCQASEALDFDHIRGEKKFSPSLGVSMKRKSIDEEIEKCDIVCANCHRIRTFNRKRLKSELAGSLQ